MKSSFYQEKKKKKTGIMIGDKEDEEEEDDTKLTLKIIREYENRTGIKKGCRLRRKAQGRGKMKKIPTLFERTFENHSVTDIKPVLSSPDLQWVLWTAKARQPLK